MINSMYQTIQLLSRQAEQKIVYIGTHSYQMDQKLFYREWINSRGREETIKTNFNIKWEKQSVSAEFIFF